MGEPVTPLTPQELAQQELDALHESWFHKDCVAFDQMVNVFAGGNPDETISSRMARWATEDTGFKKGFGSAVCEALNRIEPDHGAKAEAADLERAKDVESILGAAITLGEAKE